MKMKKIISAALCLLFVFTMLSAAAYADIADYTVTVAATSEGEEITAGDVVTVKVTVSGAQFVAAQMTLSYDTEIFEYISSMAGWSDTEDGRLSFLNVNSAGAYWDDGKVLGTFKFMVKDDAPAGESIFSLGANGGVYIVATWEDGLSSEPAKPLAKEQLVNAAVTIAAKEGSEPQEEAPAFGALSDDGDTVTMEKGYHVYSIADTDSDPETVTWTSSDESVATVSPDGLVTAVADGSAVITAIDEAGNELEQRTIVVGEKPAEPEPVEEEPAVETAEPAEPVVEPVVEPAPSPATVEEPASESSSGAIVWIVIIAAVVAAVIVIVILSKKKSKK